MAGHVFIVRGDLRRLACDAWLMPCDARGRPEDKWLLSGESVPSRAWKEGKSRVREVPDWPAGRPRPWLVNMDGGDEAPAGWYVEGVREFLDAVRPRMKGQSPLLRRCRPLIALPVVGTGEGGGREQAGQILSALLSFLQQAVRRDDWDIALVAFDGPAFAAAQAARLQQGESSPWPELDESLRARADELAGQASRGELALFLGAGVSAAAGMPLWGELLERLAEKAGMSADERKGLGRLNPLDQAGVIERRLGGADGLQKALREVFAGTTYALPHALLAALPVREVVTTNYDQLLEAACEATGQKVSVLPYLLRPGADRWVLKLHGSITHPEDIVLTREDQFDFSRQHGALAGIVQTLLITRHMLFVGFSLTDDNFHRIADAVRRVVRASDPGGDGRPFGTVLVLERSPLLEELWANDLEWVGMAGRPGGHAADARRLEIFLDYLLARTRDAAHLLDDRYRAVLTGPENELRSALLRLRDEASPAARQTAAWFQVEQLLRAFGLGPEG